MKLLDPGPLNEPARQAAHQPYGFRLRSKEVPGPRRGLLNQSGVLGLQRLAGNRAVASLLIRDAADAEKETKNLGEDDAGGRNQSALPSSIVLQRQLRGSRTNDQRKLKDAHLEDLFDLYLLTSSTHTVARTGATYTRQWVRQQSGTRALRLTIEKKLKWQLENDPDVVKNLRSSLFHVTVQGLLSRVQGTPSDATRKQWIVDRLTFYLNLAVIPTAAAFHKKYQVEVRPIPGGGCMTALYKGTSVLFSEQETKDIRKGVKDALDKVRARAKKSGKTKEAIEQAAYDANSVDLILETMRKQGRAGEKISLKYDRTTKKWQPSLEDTVLSNVGADPGWYFFGLSVSGGYHSVILVVDTARSSGSRVYWMDQFSRGFTKDVTGRLDKELKEWKPSYGYAETRVWRILPTEKTVITLPLKPTDPWD